MVAWRCVAMPVNQKTPQIYWVAIYLYFSKIKEG
jgi:hypothetical protein